MNDAVKLGKKVFTFVVVALTAAYTVGLPALSLNVAKAVNCPALEAGDLVKANGNSAVYMLNANKERLYFPHANVYKSWYKDYTGIVTVDPSCLEAIATPKVPPFGVNFRAGSTLVKLQAFNTVYAVEPGNTLAKITSWDAVTGLGYSAKDIKDVSDAFWANYVSRGADITEAMPYNGMLMKVAGNSTVYLVKDGKKVAVDGTVMTSSDVRTVSQSVLDKVATGTGTVTASSVYDNPAQGVGSVVPPVQPVGGSLTVALAADTPAARTVADGTIYNDLLKVNLSAGSAAVKVTGITLTKTGLISNTNISGVSVWDGQGNRHGDVMTSLTSDNKITVSFASYPIVVGAGTTESLLVRVDLADTAASSLVGFKVAAATDLSTDGTVTGNFPIESNQLSVVDGSSSIASFTVASSSIGGITNGSETTAAGNLDIGQTQKEIGKFKFTETSGREDITLERIVFYLEGSVQDKDLKNFKVYSQDNMVLGTADMASDRYVTVKFTNPYTITKSNNRTVTLKADVMDGSGRYFRVHIQNATDMMVKGATASYYINPTTFVDTKAHNDWFKMKSGAMTITKSTTSPSGNVSAGATNIVLAKYDLTANGESLELRKMGLSVTKTGNYNLSGNVVVRDAATGETYMTLTGAEANSGGQRNLSSYINLTSGVSKTIEVVGSIDSNATSTNTILVKVGQFYGKRLSTLDFADNLGSASVDQSANTLTISTLSLSFVKDTSMGNKTVATGNSQVVGQFIVRAGSAEPLKITGASIKFNGNGVINVPTAMQNLELWNGTTKLGSTISSVATTSNAFSFELPLAVNESKVLQLKATLTSSASGSVSSSVSGYSYVGTGSSGQSATGGSDNSGTDVVGQDITVGSANAILSAVTDSSSISRIYTTSATPVQLGKWKLEAQNEDLTLKKITFTVRDESYADDTSAGNFGELSLYDGSNMTTPLATASYVPGSSNGYVQFTGLSMPVTANSYKYLVLKGTVNGSGTMNSNSINEFVVTDDSSSNMEISSASGATLGTSAIDAISGDNTTNSRFATSTFYKFHDAYPTVSAVSISSLSSGSNTPVFKYTVKNEGTRDMRIATTTIAMTVTGLTGNNTATGSIGGWKLWEANEAGNIGTQLAATTSVALAPNITALTTSAGYADVGYAAGTAINLAFGEGNDTNSMLANFVVAPGASRTFIVTADTTNIGLGKGSTAFTVQVSGKITGTTGWSGSTWNTGNFQYFYTPVNGSENGTAYTATDSYDVAGNVISASF